MNSRIPPFSLLLIMLLRRADKNRLLCGLYSPVVSQASVHQQLFAPTNGYIYGVASLSVFTSRGMLARKDFCNPEVRIRIRTPQLLVLLLDILEIRIFNCNVLRIPRSSSIANTMECLKSFDQVEVSKKTV